MFGVPLVLGLLELGHPALLPGDDIVATIAPIDTSIRTTSMGADHPSCGHCHVPHTKRFAIGRLRVDHGYPIPVGRARLQGPIPCPNSLPPKLQGGGLGPCQAPMADDYRIRTIRRFLNQTFQLIQVIEQSESA